MTRRSRPHETFDAAHEDDENLPSKSKKSTKKGGALEQLDRQDLITLGTMSRVC